jgi:predicted ATPase
MPELTDAMTLPALEPTGIALRRERMLRELAQTLPALAEWRPIILLFEDLHWADTSTLTLISYLARQHDPARLLILATFRPEVVRSRPHPLWEIVQSLAQQELCEEVVLRQLDSPDVASFLDARLSPHRLPSELSQQLRCHTSGNPLFMTRVVEGMIKAGRLLQVGEYWQLSEDVQGVTFEVPPSIGALIEGEVERLSELERQVLEAASVAGAEFWVAAVSSVIDVDLATVEEVCRRWSRSGRFLREQAPTDVTTATRGLQCTFIHALYQQVVAERIPPARRARLHSRIGAWLEATYARNLRAVASELAMHFERALDAPRAISYRQLAGEQSLMRCAYQEAIVHLHAAQELRSSMPDGPERLRTELALLCTLGIPLAMTQGYASPEVERVYLRAWDLCRDGEDVERLPRVLTGLSVCYAVRGSFDKAREFADQAARLAQVEPPHAASRQEANLAQLLARFHLGEFDQVREHTARAIESFDVADTRCVMFSIHQDLRTTTSLMLSWPLWSLGHPDRARYWAERGVELATGRSDHFATAQCLAYLTVIHLLRGERLLATSRAEKCRKLCVEHGFRLFHTSALMALGSVRVEEGDTVAGIAMLREGWESRKETGARLNSGFWCALIARAYASAGMFEQAMEMLEEAFELTRALHERWWEPELHRLRAGLYMQAAGARSLENLTGGVHETPEVACLRALELARSMGAKSLELRAATTLSRIWDEQQRSAAARQMLAGIHDSFTEGHDTQDLREARAQLQKLATKRGSGKRVAERR